MPPDRIDRQRHPLRREHLQVRKLRDAIRRETEEQSGEDCRGRAAGEVAREQERAKRRQHIREEERDVVAEDRITGREVHRQHQQCLRREMFGVGEREGCRMEDPWVPPLVPGRPVSGAEAGDVPGRPLEDPRIQDRIPQVPWERTRHRRDERPRPGHREHRIEQNSPCCAAPGSWPLEARGHAVLTLLAYAVHRQSSRVSSSKRT